MVDPGLGAEARAGSPRRSPRSRSFLASDRASFLTGAVIPIDGGTTAALQVSGSAVTGSEHGRLLRPVRRRHQRRSLPDVPPAARRGADLLQRALRRLGAVAPRPTSRRASSTGRRSRRRRGDILEIVQSGMELPSGVVLFEDPPLHTMHRGLMSRVFTPRRMNALEDQVREYCARCLDPLVGADRFDFVADLGAEMPMRVIGMLLGIPESRPERRSATVPTRPCAPRPGKPMEVQQDAIANGEMFAEYIDWRAAAPVRRPDDRAAQRRVRGRDRHDAHAHPRARCSRTRRCSRARATRPPAG